MWRNFIEKIEANGAGTDINDEDYEFLSSVVLNGRQIKNAARTALSLAENANEKLSLEAIKSVLGIVQAFEDDFKNREVSALGNRVR